MSTSTEHRDPGSLTQVSARNIKGSSTGTGVFALKLVWAGLQERRVGVQASSLHSGPGRGRCPFKEQAS